MVTKVQSTHSPKPPEPTSITPSQVSKPSLKNILLYDVTSTVTIHTTISLDTPPSTYTHRESPMKLNSHSLRISAIKHSTFPPIVRSPLKVRPRTTVILTPIGNLNIPLPHKAIDQNIPQPPINLNKFRSAQPTGSELARNILVKFLSILFELSPNKVNFINTYGIIGELNNKHISPSPHQTILTCLSWVDTVPLVLSNEAPQN